MATLYVTEYEHLALAPEGEIPVGKEPALTTQALSIGGASVPSAAFNARTNFVRLHTDAICSVVFGGPSNPTATSGNARMAANQTEYFGVIQGIGAKVAVITNT